MVVGLLATGKKSNSSTDFRRRLKGIDQFAKCDTVRAGFQHSGKVILN